MRARSIFPILALTAGIILTSSQARAGFPSPPGILIPPGIPGPSVNVHVDGYLPAPPGVHVMIDSGRPYYMESDRRVYIEKKKPHKNYKKKKYKKEKKHHEDHGNHYGKEKHGKHGH